MSSPLPGPRLYRPHRESEAPPAGHACLWMINGRRATVTTWTAEEWARLPHRPGDAQQFGNGTWCDLRVD